MTHRNTIQRDMVLEAVHKLNHPSADEVFRVIQSSYPAISRATVYRNLGLLVEQGRLRRVSLPDLADHFDITLPGHYHIACKGCGKVVDAELPYMSTLLDGLSRPHGFVVDEHDIVLRGYCPDCQAAVPLASETSA